jgi:predicted double-glycine peptidase
MELDFEELMTKKSEDGLMEYVTNINRYTPESIVAAVNELKKRGRQLTDEELGTIKVKIQEKLATEKKENEIWSTNSWKENVVESSNAPQYYSHQAIWGFSTAFTVIFGAVKWSTLSGRFFVKYINPFYCYYYLCCNVGNSIDTRFHY